MNNKEVYTNTLNFINGFRSQGEVDTSKEMKHTLNKLLPKENSYHQYLRERGLEN